MLHKHAFRRAVVAALLLVAFLCQATWTLAGTTGGVSGQVTDQHGAPIAGANITIASPSQTVSATTDSHGHYAFLSLAPDTYTLSVSKSGYANASYPGISVFADQTQVLAVQLAPALKNIANVTAKTQGSLVKAGTSVDVYAVNQSTQTQVQLTGGGNNIDNAYSAIYSQPGVNPLPGNFGFNQVFYIHGSNYGQIGYEFDGIPVNRAFDNYKASSLSTLGTVSTEVYTGGGPAAGVTPTLGGYINQVIKTGTFPGYASLSGGVGTPAFYHQAQVEAGGATPDRNFSWYVGLRGSDMIPNQINAQNAGDLTQDGNNQYGIQGIGEDVTLYPFQTVGFAPLAGPWSTCLPNGNVPSGATPISPLYAALYGKYTPSGTCQAYGPVYSALTTALGGNQLSDRENVINLHIGVPHRNDAGRDDVQLLFNNYYYQTTQWNNTSTNGGMPWQEQQLGFVGGATGAGAYSQFLQDFGLPALGTPAQGRWASACDYVNFYAELANTNACPATGQTPYPYADAYQVVNAHFGQSAANATNIVAPYLFPSSPTDRVFGSGFSPYQVSNTGNNGSILKAQYTKNFSSSAFLRLYGYSFYSDWLQNNPNYSPGWTPFNTGGGTTAADYELDTHTVGGGLTFADQINAMNLITLSSNYVTANYLRWNNGQYSFTPGSTPIATLMTSNGKCFSARPNEGAQGTVWDASYSSTLPIGSPVSCLSPLAGATIGSVVTKSLPAITGPAAAAGATWQLTQNLAPDANLSQVGPRFLNAALQDEIRPSDRWDINAGIRYESYGYALGNYSSASQQFWFNQINETVCVNPNGLVQVPASDFQGGRARSTSVPSGYPGYYTTLPGQPCAVDPLTNVQLYHPGQHGIPQISLGQISGTLTNTTYSPRVGFTYTADPDTVLRFSYGRYTQPTPTADEQVLTYLDGYAMANALYGSQYYNNGFASIVHNNPVQFSNNWDASLEHRFPNTDWSVKVSPYYRYTTAQTVPVTLPGGLGGAFNNGTLQAEGVEFALQKGDPSRDGFSGQLSYTYTYAQEKYGLIAGQNPITIAISGLKSFYGLTKNGGGAPCYAGGAPISCSKPNAIINPYYDLLSNVKTFAQLQAQYPVNGWYPEYYSDFGSNSTALSPNLFAGWLSYKHQKWQATVTGNLWQGTQYGTPFDFTGIDPRGCLANQGGQNSLVGPTAAIVPGSKYADYQACAAEVPIPNLYTGQFNSYGQYRQPWQLNLGAQLAYELSPRITVTAAMANILNACFGGSAEPWTAAYAPNSVDCGYFANSSFVGYAPGEVYSTTGAGRYYGTNPHAAINGTTGYPKLFDQAYVPSPVQISAPFQVYFSANIRL